MDIALPSSILENLLRLNEINISEEFNKYITYWPLILIGLVLSFFLIPLIGKIANTYGFTYKPKIKRNNKDFDNPEKAIHEVETPALGGLAVTIPVVIALFLLFRLDAFTLPILVALLVLVIGSALDDIFNLPAKAQLLYQVLAATIIAISIIDLSFFTFFVGDTINLAINTWSFTIANFPLSIAFPGDIILIVWIVFCINSVKWVGGSPGLIESYSLVIFTLLFLIGVRTFSIFSSSIAVLIVGSLISLLFFAYPSPKIMSGSSGKSIYGFLIALLALISGTKISVTIILLAIPIIDALYVLLHRYLKFRPKNLIDLMKINDATHLHHQLLKLNLSSRQILMLESSITLLVSSIAILTTGAFLYFGIIFGLALVIALIVFVNYKASKKEVPKSESPESKYSY